MHCHGSLNQRPTWTQGPSRPSPSVLLINLFSYIQISIKSLGTKHDWFPLGSRGLAQYRRFLFLLKLGFVDLSKF